MLIRPPRLKHGDLIGIAAPAAPLWPAVPAAVNASFERGLAMLRRLGFGVRIAPHALSPRTQPDVPAHERAEDLNALFTDPEVRAILCVAGGWGTNGVLPLLDWSAIDRHPKIVLGYSNITALLVGIATRARLVTFHGPTILDGFSEFPEMLPYTREQLEKVICTAQPAGVLHPPAEWTSDYPHDDRPRQMEQNPGWRWLQTRPWPVSYRA